MNVIAEARTYLITNPEKCKGQFQATLPVRRLLYTAEGEAFICDSCGLTRNSVPSSSRSSGTRIDSESRASAPVKAFDLAG